MNFGPSALQLYTMLRLQDELNQRIDPHWLSAGHDYHRALMMEATEALDGYGWKWWKHHPTPVGNAQMQLELVDMWHFILSIALKNANGVTQTAAQRLLPAISEPFVESIDAHPRDLLERIIGRAADKRTAMPSYLTLMRQFDLSWDTLYKVYIAKNVLNLFRQDHGYNDGTYRKIWNGLEDNEFLAALMEREPGYGPGDLRRALEAAYLAETREQETA